MEFLSGSSYSGEFLDGRFSGSGTYRSPDGWMYQGMFANGKPDGSGIITEADGTEIAVIWSGGELMEAVTAGEG